MYCVAEILADDSQGRRLKQKQNFRDGENICRFHLQVGSKHVCFQYRYYYTPKHSIDADYSLIVVDTEDCIKVLGIGLCYVRRCYVYDKYLLQC